LDKSNLLLEGATYWVANKINIYAMEDMPEDDIKANDLIQSMLLDTMLVDSRYWYDEEKVIVNLEENRLTITGKPHVGDVVTLTYDTWYLFRGLNKEYDFKITYTDRATVSYVGDDKEYVIYQMSNDNHIVNLGYNFWGTLSVKDSYRGAMRLCNYIEYRIYLILYKKYNEQQWIKWSQFAVESRNLIYVRTGFELKDKLYMETSNVKIGPLISPFLAYWDGQFISVVGGVQVDNKGVASSFGLEDYLEMKMYNLMDGDLVEFQIQLSNIDNQGIGTQVYLQKSHLTSNNVQLQKVYENYRAIVQYHIRNGRVYPRIIGNNTMNLQYDRSDAYVLTIIPYNQDLPANQVGHYVKSLDDAEKLSVYYRIGHTQYDHFVTPVLDWYHVPLTKHTINYFGEVLENVYIAQIPLGFEYDRAHNAVNTNPDNLEYLKGHIIEYKIVNKDGLVTTNKTNLYANKLEKQRTRF
jgi:hypothetical protein